MTYYNYEKSAAIGDGYLSDYVMVYDYTWQKGTKEAKVWAVAAATAEEAARAVLEDDVDVDCEPMGYEVQPVADGRELDLTKDIMAVVSFDGRNVTIMFTDTDPEDLASLTLLDGMYDTAYLSDLGV